MNWYNRSAWIYENSVVDFAKIKKYNINLIYLDPRSTNLPQVMSDLHANNVQFGAYFSQSWQPTLLGPAYADYVSKTLNQSFPKGLLAEAPPCMLDLETKDVGWAQDCIKRYRAHQPHRPTSYTNAPFQGAYVPSYTLNTFGLHAYIQLYYGDMRAADASAALLEQARNGIPAANLHPFYDGATLPYDSRDGCIFTLERLP